MERERISQSAVTDALTIHLSAVALAKVERLAPRHQQNLPEQTVTVFATPSQIHLLILPFYF